MFFGFAIIAKAYLVGVISDLSRKTLVVDFVKNGIEAAFMAHTFILVMERKETLTKTTKAMKTNNLNHRYMKKHITFFIFMMLLMLVIFGKASAQEGNASEKVPSYFKIGFGYGFPSGSQMIGSNASYTYSATSSSSHEKGIYGSMGTGLILNTSYVHMYSKNVGLDINLQYLWGKKYESQTTATDSNGGTIFYKSSVYSRGFLFGPSLLFRVGEKKVKPYVQMGIELGKLKVVGEESADSYKSTSEYTGGLSFGFKGGFGMDASISEKTIFFTELVFTSMSYYPKEGKITYSSGPQQKIEYVREITTNYTNSPSNSNTRKELRSSVPFGNVALSAGFKFRLTKKV